MNQPHPPSDSTGGRAVSQGRRRLVKAAWTAPLLLAVGTLPQTARADGDPFAFSPPGQNVKDGGSQDESAKQSDTEQSSQSGSPSSPSGVHRDKRDPLSDELHDRGGPIMSGDDFRAYKLRLLEERQRQGTLLDR